MYLNASDTLCTASLVSVREISPGPVCVSLYYYIDHNTTTLTISQKDSTSGQTTTIMKIVGSEEVSSWTEVMFNTRILIEGSTEGGEIAIDDVTVQYGDCPIWIEASTDQGRVASDDVTVLYDFNPEKENPRSTQRTVCVEVLRDNANE
uniref:MAM domain-containing protein n=1 Tax=Magallana gigas TaxID=29159 RepID=K1PGG2_MAGGI